MKNSITFLLLLISTLLAAQSPDRKRAFCDQLNEIFEHGRKDNFEALSTMSVPKSIFLQAPAFAVKLTDFPVLYVDKDNRLVGKTSLSLDSVTAAGMLDDFRSRIDSCLNSYTWNVKWITHEGNDPETVFFTEEKLYRAFSQDLNLAVAMSRVAPKTFSINIYIQRNKH